MLKKSKQVYNFAARVGTTTIIMKYFPRVALIMIYGRYLNGRKYICYTWKINLISQKKGKNDASVTSY